MSQHVTAFGVAGHEVWHSASLAHELGHAPPAPDVVLVVVLVAALAVLLVLAVVPAGAPPAPPLVTTGSQPPSAKNAARKIS